MPCPGVGARDDVEVLAVDHADELGRHPSLLLYVGPQQRPSVRVTVRVRVRYSVGRVRVRFDGVRVDRVRVDRVKVDRVRVRVRSASG